MAPDESTKLLMQLQSLCSGGRRWKQKQKGDRKGGDSRAGAETKGEDIKRGSLRRVKARLETVSQLTVATQRLSKGRGNRGGRRAKRKEVAARGDRKVKEVGKVGNSGSFPCDSSRSD